MEFSDVRELIAKRVAAKRAEDEAIAARREIDEQLALQLQTGKVEGSETTKIDGYKITVSYKLNRKVDAEALKKDWDKLSYEQQSAFSWKPDVSVTNLKKLETADLIAASKFITTTPAAPSVKIELA